MGDEKRLSLLGTDFMTQGPVREDDKIEELEELEEKKDLVSPLLDTSLDDTCTKDQIFTPGSIHAQEVFSYWRDELQASPWVLHILQHGYKIPFRELPQVYEEPNNASARAEPKVVEDLVSQMIDEGIVEIVKVKPHCVSPLGLVKKALEDGSFKYRLVFDASRCVNLKLEEKHVSLAHLEKALELTEADDYQSIFDLKSCYYHLKIFQPHQKYLGACFMLKGKKVYFQYKHLPFGLASAVHVITKIMKPIISKIQGLGIKFSIYIDDGRFLATSVEQADQFRDRVYEVLTRSGWQISVEKSDKKGQASKKKKYLGFIIDTSLMKVSADAQKVVKVKEMIRESRADSVVAIRRLAKVLGNIIGLLPSHGFAARVASKSGYALIEKHISEFGWKGHVCLDQATKDEWDFFLTAIESNNGMPIRSNLNDIRVDTVLENPTTKQVFVPNHRAEDSQIWISDASAFKVVAFNLTDKSKHNLSVMLSEDEKKRSSGYRELLAVDKTVQYWSETGFRNQHIYWCTDSSNAVSFLSKGSGKSHLQEVIFRIARRLQELGIVITPIHLLRDDPRIVQADELSKIKDSDDWSVDDASFQSLDRVFHFTLDLFASRENRKVEKFYSEFLTPSTLGIDAFSQDWSDQTLWICAPIKFLIRIARRVRKTEVQGVVLVPDWSTSSFYSFYFDIYNRPKAPFIEVKRWRPFIYQNQGAEGPLNGKIEFDLVALFFNTRKNYNMRFISCGE